MNEGVADVHNDPLLFTSCALDLQQYCNDIPFGTGKSRQLTVYWYQFLMVDAVNRNYMFTGSIHNQQTTQAFSRMLSAG